MTVIQRFEEQVWKNPEKLAVKSEQYQMTYEELNRDSNSIAHAILRELPKKSAAIAMLFEHGMDMIKGIMGVLKAGKIYVPLDTAYPLERLTYILEDAGADVILTNRMNMDKASKIAGGKCRIINIDEIDADMPKESPEIEIEPSQAAVILYTSGSTGKPKGVIQTHGNITHFIKEYSEELCITSFDRIALFTSYSHTVSVIDIFSALFNGALIMPYDIKYKSGMEKMPEWLREQGITIYHSVPTVYRYCMDILKENEILDKIRLVILGGEAVSSKDVEMYRNHFSDQCFFVNLFGCSEVLVASSFILDKSMEIDDGMVPAGYFVHGVDAYLLNEKGEEVPVFTPGEIVYKSEYLAAGYWNQPEKTREVFIEDPVTGQGLVYKSGDLGRILPDGSLEYIGRKDFQVKVRGHRIEPGEIEAAMDGMEGIKKSVVTSFENKKGEYYLAAYFVPQDSYKPDRKTIRTVLKEKLPDYMIPLCFIQLDMLPLTPNGKIDRKALIEPENTLEETVYQKPQNEMEEKLADIWGKVLDLKRVGIEDNWFQLGGHSLSAARLIFRIHQEFGIELTLKQALENPTVKQQVKLIQDGKSSQFSSIQPAEKREYYAVSSAQKRLFALSNMENISTTYNIPIFMVLEGALDAKRLEDVFHTLIKRHEALRTSFDIEGGTIVQKVHEDFDFQVSVWECEESKVNKVMEEFIRPFDLSSYPLLRVGLIKIEEEKHILMFDMHHIISDGTSMGILIKEFKTLYNGQDLPPLKLQYKDFAQWQKGFFKTDAVKSQREYWAQVLSKNVSHEVLPLDFRRSELKTFNGKEIPFFIGPDIAGKLNSIAKRENVTLNALMFSLYSLLLHEYSEQQDIMIGTLVAGRNHADLQSIVGVFMNYLPVRLGIHSDNTFLEFLTATHETLLNTYQNQDIPFEEMIDISGNKTNPSRNPLFDTMLVFHNEFDTKEDISVEGLNIYGYEFDKKSSTLDMKLDIYMGTGGGLRCLLEYNTDLFKETTAEDIIKHFNGLIDCIVNDPGKKISDMEILTESEKAILIEKRALVTVPVKTPVSIVIAASFTAEPVGDYIKWWCTKHHEEAVLEFAPYNQIFQQLLDPGSLISKNNGLNILLIRFEDWIRDDVSSDVEKVEKLQKISMDLESAIKGRNNTSPCFIGIFPIPVHTVSSPLVVDKLSALYEEWKNMIFSEGNMYLVDFHETQNLYGIEGVFDETKDSMGHLPFSDEYFAAIGTVIARSICALRRPQFKAVVLDCDNTLWQGVCGEDGAEGVRVTEPYRKLQEFMLQKYNEGMLLLLCSKNNEGDVWEVFDKNKGMLLKREHFAAWRINWNNKPQNIKNLSNELNIAPDSLIYVDDNPWECGSVMQHVPEVLTLCLPENSEIIPLFLRHVWAFDRLKITREDMLRTSMYHAERKRKEIKKEGISLEEYLKSLNIKASMDWMSSEQASRVSQLSQRVTQFNLSSIRRTESEIVRLSGIDGVKVWVIEASDRFGSYGMVGVVITKEQEGSLFIDTFLLSCRILGKDIEHAVLAGLGRYLEENSLEGLKAVYYPTSRNRPFLDFLEKSGWEKVEESENRKEYRLVCENLPTSPSHIDFYYLSACKKDENTEEINKEGNKKDENRSETKHSSGMESLMSKPLPQSEVRMDTSNEPWRVVIENEAQLVHGYHLLPLRYCQGQGLLKLPLSKVTGRKNIQAEYQAPGNDTEHMLADTWQRVLGVEKVGIDDDFYQLGGDSIKAVIIVSQLKNCNLSMELKDFLTYRTIRRLSAFLKPLERKPSQDLVKGEIQLTPVQKCFFSRNFTDPQHWTAAILLYRKEGFHEDAVKKVFSKIVEHHDALRLEFSMDGEQIVQYNRGMETELFYLHTWDFTGQSDYKEKILQAGYEIQNSTGLYNSHMLRLGLFKTHVGDYFLLACHHLACDGYSLMILIQDFCTGYFYETNNQEILFPEKTDSYMQWSKQINLRANSKDFLEEQLEYWTKVDKTRVKPLPKDKLITGVRRFRDSHSVKGLLVTKDGVDKIRKELYQAYGTSTQDILLTGLGMAVKEWTGEDSVLVRLGGHGRDVKNGDLNITRTVGWFGVSYPIILDMSCSKNISDQIVNIKEMLQKVPGRGEGYDMLRFCTSQENLGSLKFALEPEIYFNNKVIFFDTFKKNERPPEEKPFLDVPDIPDPLDRSTLTEREYTFNFTLWVEDGNIVLEIDYDVNEYEESTVQSIFDNYKKTMQKIVNQN